MRGVETSKMPVEGIGKWMLIVAKQLKETKDEFGKDKCVVTVIRLSSAVLRV